MNGSQARDKELMMEREIACQLGIPRWQVNTTLKRALEKLRRHPQRVAGLREAMAEKRRVLDDRLAQQRWFDFYDGWEDP